MSALPPIADMVQHDPDVRFVPKADSCSAAKSALIRSPGRLAQAAPPASYAKRPVRRHGYYLWTRARDSFNPAYVQRLDFCTEFLSVCAILAADVCHRILVRWRSS